MSANKKIIMAWSKCKVEFGDVGDNDAFASKLFDVGKIRNQTTELSSNDGDTLTETASGGEVVAEEMLDGTLQLQTTIIEPSPELYKELGIAEDETNDGEQRVKTHVVPGEKSIKVTPKNKGARGIKAPCCALSVAPAMDEQNGNGLVLTAKIHKTTALDPTYYKKGADGWAETKETTDIAAAIGTVGLQSELPSDAKTGDVYELDNNYWYSRFTTKTALR
jgi:hypothetical protein